MGIKKEWFHGGIQALEEGLMMYMGKKYDNEHKVAWYKVFSVLLPIIFQPYEEIDFKLTKFS